MNMQCHDLSLGFVTKARGMERCGLIMQPKSHIHIPKSARECKGMSPHIPKCALILGLSKFQRMI